RGRRSIRQLTGQTPPVPRAAVQASSGRPPHLPRRYSPRPTYCRRVAPRRVATTIRSWCGGMSSQQEKDDQRPQTILVTGLLAAEVLAVLLIAIKNWTIVEVPAVFIVGLTIVVLDLFPLYLVSSG